jgi:hypothetical protein
MIPRVRTYWRPVRIRVPAADGRRWVGVEPQTAEPVGQEVMLGRQVTKYHVRGTIFATRTPFEGDVWTTAENIVIRAEGTGTVDGFKGPLVVKTVQLTVGPVDRDLFSVPSNFVRESESSSQRDD